MTFSTSGAGHPTTAAGTVSGMLVLPYAVIALLGPAFIAIGGRIRRLSNTIAETHSGGRQQDLIDMDRVQVRVALGAIRVDHPHEHRCCAIEWE